MKKPIFAALLLSSLQAEALVLHVQFTGEVDSLDHVLMEQFDIGDTFNVRLSIDTMTNQSDDLGINAPWFGNAVTSLTVNSGDYNAVLDLSRNGSGSSGEGSCGVVVDQDRDLYNIQGCTQSNSFVGYPEHTSIPLQIIGEYIEFSGYSFTDIETLEDIPLLSDGNDWSFRHHFVTNDGSNYHSSLSGYINDMSVTVSEPAHFALLGLGLAGLGAVRTRKVSV